MRIIVKIVAMAHLPSQFGSFNIIAFYDPKTRMEHVALVKGEVEGKEDVLVRLHSECLTGEVFASLRCDCREQLITAMEYIERHGCGVLLYLRQEGRGIGLINKIKAYYLQEHGYDTAEANIALGFKDDLRDYKTASKMLGLLKVKSVNLLTNNPKKIEGLEKNGIKISKRTPLEIRPNIYNAFYLKTKKEKFGHLINTVR